MSKLNRNLDKPSKQQHVNKRIQPRIRKQSFVQSLVTPKTLRTCGIIIIFIMVVCSGWYTYNKIWPPLKLYVQTLSSKLGYYSGLHINTLLVEGRHYANPTAVQQAIAYKKDDFIFNINPQEIKQRLESLSWIRSAIVQRQWPAMVYIRLTEQRPIALWQKDHQYFLIDDCGAIIDTRDFNAFKSLPILTGDDAPRQAPAFLDVLQHFPKIKTLMSGASLVGKRRWDVIINNKLTVNLPEDDIQDELEYLSQLMNSNDLDGENIISIDLRTADRAYFYLKDNVLKNKAIAAPKRI